MGSKLFIRKSVWLLIVICFVSTCMFAARPSAGVQLLSMVSALAALVTLVLLAIQSATRWRQHGLANLVACMLLVLSFPAAVHLGHAIRGVVFNRDLDRWYHAANWVMTHGEPNLGRPVGLPLQYSDLAPGVHYKIDQTCGLMIDFFWGGGFPVKHTVRRYAANPDWVDVKQCSATWRRGRHLSGNWYEISD